MASRPRRAAAQKANTAITDMVDTDNLTNSRTGRIMSSRGQSRRSDAKLPASKLRHSTTSRTGQSTRQALVGSRESFEGGEILQGKRNRGQKKSYVVDSSDDDDDDDDEDAEGEEDEDAEGEDDDMADLADEDAEGEIVVDDSMDMDVDAEGEDEDALGEDDADGEDDDMAIDTPVPTIKVSKASKGAGASKARTAAKASAKAAAQDNSDDDELSDLDSDDDEIQDTVKVGGGEDEDEDAEGEEDDDLEATAIAGKDDDDELDSDEDGEAPDLTKMTKRQRARFEEGDGALLKLSDEVQAKKHFTAEELSMRRAEMARRRRNLSEKRNEEVKRETIDKLLKKQAPKINRKAQLAGDDGLEGESRRANPVFVRWVSNKNGSLVAVPDEMLTAPPGRVFIPGGLKGGKMVEEVS